MNDLLASLSLLTSVPLKGPPNFTARALVWFPLVGAGLGAVLVAVHLLASLILAPLVTGTVVVIFWAVFTGGLHLDGLTDSMDALFAETTRERRLEILRDVHIGAFGAAGLVLVLILKVAAASAATAPYFWAAPILGRWAIVLAAAFPLARNDGMAAQIARGLTRREIAIATVLAIALVVPLGWVGVAAFITAIVATLLLAQLARTRLGGLTGDIYGMICELSEVGILVLGAAL